MNNKSIADRKKSFLEDCCGGAGAPTMSMGDAGYQSDAPAEGPVAGYDPMLGKKKRKSSIETAKRLRKEGYKPISQEKEKMIRDKGNKIANQANDMEEKDAERLTPKYDYDKDIMPKYKRAEKLQNVAYDAFKKRRANK